MARGKRSHPTDCLGVVPNTPMSEINTVHAFGANGRETNGWPFAPTAFPGTSIGGTKVYRAPRATQDPMGGPSSRQKRRR